MQKRIFVKNAAIMTVTSLLLRTIGIFFRIYVSNRVGAEGMGLYQLIVSVYVLASSFAAAGLTTAVTRLCAEEFVCGTTRSAKRILHYAVLISSVVGLLSAILIVGGSSFIADVFLHDMRAVPSLKILTISLPFMGISSCIKGYFLARRKITSSSISQLLEQIVRILSIVAILSANRIDNVEGACFAILLGDAIAEIVSCGYMCVCYCLDKRHLSDAGPIGAVKHPIKQMLHITLPITGGRYLGSGLRTVENVTVPTMLEKYTLSRETALSQFGKLKGMAMPLLFFPSSFLNAFTALLIPEIAEAKALCQQKRLEHTVKQALQFTLLSSFLIGGLFWVMAYPLGELIYHDVEVGQMLRILSPLAPVMYLESVIVGILKGLDQQTHSLLYSILDSASRIALIVAALPTYGIYGFFGIMVFSNLLTCSLNFYRLCKVTHLKIDVLKIFIFPILALITAISIASAITAMLHVNTVDQLAYCVICGAIVVAVYVGLLIPLGCINRNDMTWFKPLCTHK